jgi:hypothetical protein
LGLLSILPIGKPGQLQWFQLRQSVCFLHSESGMHRLSERKKQRNSADFNILKRRGSGSVFLF